MRDFLKPYLRLKFSIPGPDSLQTKRPLYIQWIDDANFRTTCIHYFHLLFSSSIGGDPGAIVKFDDHDDGEEEWVDVKNLRQEDEVLSTSEEE